MIYLAWSASGRDAVEGRTVFSRPGGGTKLGERLTGLRSPCAPTRPPRAWSARRS